MRAWLSKKLKNGFWVPVFITLIRHLYERGSIGYRFKQWLKTDGKSPRGASELYQVCWLVTAVLWLSLIKLPVSLLSETWARNLGVLIAAYRILEIVLFALHWVFVTEDERLHGVRRSLAGFLLNIVEISLYTSIALLLMQCETAVESQWAMVYSNIKATFGLSLPQTANNPICHVSAHSQLVAASILLPLVVASLVGGLLRNTK